MPYLVTSLSLNVKLSLHIVQGLVSVFTDIVQCLVPIWLAIGDVYLVQGLSELFAGLSLNDS